MSISWHEGGAPAHPCPAARVRGSCLLKKGGGHWGRGTVASSLLPLSPLPLGVGRIGFEVASWFLPPTFTLRKCADAICCNIFL